MLNITNTNTPKQFALSVLLDESDRVSAYFRKVDLSYYLKEKTNEALGNEVNTELSDNEIHKKWTLEEWTAFKADTLAQAMQINKLYLEGVVAGLHASWWQLYLQTHKDLNAHDFPKPSDNEVSNLIETLMERF